MVQFAGQFDAESHAMDGASCADFLRGLLRAECGLQLQGILTDAEPYAKGCVA